MAHSLFPFTATEWDLDETSQREVRSLSMELSVDSSLTYDDIRPVHHLPQSPCILNHFFALSILT